MQRTAKLTANLTVRITPEADQLRRELQQRLELPANQVAEEAFRALKAELERSRASEPT